MRIAVAMSGGVDSSVVALLMKQEGLEVIGLTMDIPALQRSLYGEPLCEQQADDPAAIADLLGIELHFLDFEQAFRARVFDPFVDAYVQGHTPNPCALCNPRMKFGFLLDAARAHGAEMLATGHYARIEKDEKGRTQLLRGVDKRKDQSYFLFGLKRPVLEKVRFPLGSFSKPEVRRLAEAHGLPLGDAKESQDVCFIREGSYADLIASDKRLISIGKGNIVNQEGEILGTHDGYWRYTIGQRRGLGVAAPERLFVSGLDPERNRVIVGPLSALFHSKMIVSDLSLCSRDTLAHGLRVECKIRSRSAAVTATLHAPSGGVVSPGDSFEIHFDEPQKAITPGQAAVLYDGDTVLGGGWIEKAFDDA